MPYIAFDLDALSRVPDAARAAGLAEDALGYGLLRLWSWCFKEKTDKVGTPHLAGFFGGEGDRVPTALVAFGFLELIQGGGFRVKGAERYLRVSEARKAGGKAAKGNLIPGPHKKRPKIQRQPEGGAGGQPETQPERSRKEAGEYPEAQPETLSGSSPALTPSTEYLLLSSKEEPAAEPPAWREAWDALSAVFHEITGRTYRVDRKADPPALKALLADGLPEVLMRWRRGLENTKYGRYPGVASVAQLRSKWNDLAVERSTAPPEKGLRAPPDSMRRGGHPCVEPECDRTAEATGRDGKWRCYPHLAGATA